MAKRLFRCAARIGQAGFFAVHLFAIATVLAQDAGYNQQYRPQVHFSPQKHWTNDPNGLVYFHGEYHLFFQYNPFGDEWGHMSWGHAVSRDLLHWKELPVAIPEQDGTMIFTGSVVIDRKSSSGFCASAKPCMVAVYTGYHPSPSGDRQDQNLAYSHDDGRTWTKYQGNPVLDLHLVDFRDPSVNWDEALGQWLMAVSLPKEHKVQFYSSPDLKHWTHQSDFGPAGDTDGDWECPDLLHIPSQKMAASGSPELWALKVGLNPGAPQGGSGEQYFLGSFDGKTFTVSTASGAHGWTNYGKDDYCAISFNGLPTGQDPVLLGWMSNWQYAAKLPTSPWRGQMSLPRRLSFIQDANGFALVQQPVIAPLREKEQIVSTGTLSGSGLKLSAPYELDLQFGATARDVFGIRLYSDEQHWTEVGFDRKKSEFYIDRTHAGLRISPEFTGRTVAPLVAGVGAAGRPFDLQLIVDRSSVEAFAQNGTIAMTDLVFPSSDMDTIKIIPGTAHPTRVTGRAWALKSIWDQAARPAAR